MNWLHPLTAKYFIAIVKNNDKDLKRNTVILTHLGHQFDHTVAY